MSFATANMLPGVQTAVQSVENEFGWGPQTPFPAVGVVLVSTAVDTGTPTTVLRKGLVLGKITATGKYREYLPANTDGSQFPVGVLRESVDMIDPRTGSAADKYGLMQVWGLVKPGSLYGFDENARVQMSPRFYWDDLRQECNFGDRTVAKTADYTVTAAENGTIFTTEGAAGAVIFTLPAPARGYRFRFLNAVNQNMTVAAGAGLLIAFNNAAATSIAFSTAGNKIGAGVEVTVTADGTKYIAQVLTTATATIA